MTPEKATWKVLEGEENNKTATDNSFEKLDYEGRKLLTVFSQTLGSQLSPSSSPPSSLPSSFHPRPVSSTQ